MTQLLHLFFFSLLKFVGNLKTKTKGLGKDNDFVAGAQSKDLISSAQKPSALYFTRHKHDFHAQPPAGAPRNPSCPTVSPAPTTVSPLRVFIEEGLLEAD